MPIMGRVESVLMETSPQGRSAKSNERFLVYPYWLAAVVWLPFNIPPLIALFQMPFSLRLLLTLAGVAFFIAIYVWTAWDSAYRLAGFLPPRRFAVPGPLWLPVAVLLLLSMVLVSFAGNAWGGMFIFTVASAGFRFSPLRTGQTIVGLDLLIIVFSWLGHQSLSYLLGQGVFLVTIVGITCIGASWAARSNRELRAARQELARLAVSEERLRFARDLHDLLGHTLSLIAIKSELAGRLVPTAPERAVAEIGDVEQAARKALQEVREAVVGYRQPTLVDELHAAREILTAAGIDFTQKGDGVVLPAPVEAVLSWAVREGVTNVIRHSRARHCTITVTQHAGSVRTEIVDDGRGNGYGGDGHTASPSSAAGHGGSGLRGLSERVAALGGTCEAGPRSGGGFRLAVSLPVEMGASATSPAALVVPTTVEQLAHEERIEAS